MEWKFRRGAVRYVSVVTSAPDTILLKSNAAKANWQEIEEECVAITYPPTTN